MYVIKALQVPYRKTPARHPPFSSANSDAKPTQIFTSVFRPFFQTISNVKRRRYKGRQSAALDRAVLWGRLPKRKRELQSPIYSAFSNFFAILRSRSGHLLRVFVFRCDARNRNHCDTHESKHSQPIEKQTELAIWEPPERPPTNSPAANEWRAPHTRCPPSEGKPCGA